MSMDIRGYWTGYFSRWASYRVLHPSRFFSRELRSLVSGNLWVVSTQAATMLGVRIFSGLIPDL
jgi:hypothetical protein